jgi:hypothetical protein
MARSELIIKKTRQGSKVRDLDSGAIFRLQGGDTFYIKLHGDCGACHGNVLSLTTYRIYNLKLESLVVETISQIIIDEIPT